MRVCFIGKKQETSSCRQILKAFKKVFPNILDICLTSLSYDNSPSIQKIKQFNPDFIFLIKGMQISNNNIDFLTKNYNVVYFFLDGLNLQRKHIKKYLYIASKSKCVLTPSHTAVEIFKKVNLNSFEFYQAVNYCQLEKASYKKPSERKNDIFFAGSFSQHRKPYIDILNHFKRSGYSVGLFGLNQFNWIKLNDLSKIASEYKIVLNILFDKSFDYVSLRNFDMIGSYNFVLSEYCKNLSKVFLNNKHISYFNDVNQFKEKIWYYLNNQQEMDKIALNGYNYVYNFHNWESRVMQLIEILKFLKIL